ncbi:hypothetical protein [Sinomicrobium oceani]|uniref:hypothetical protein n=1 Tax=Sinomicrobium oceani TaxID=1150368 RepID=UPI00227B87CC|nr:hypothetical protein [Sinomicrobium oceani]
MLIAKVVLTLLSFVQVFDLKIKLSTSKYFRFIRLKAKAPAEAVKTEKSKAPFIPVEKVIDKANSKSSNPLNFANSSVLNPIIKKTAKIISAPVAKIPMVGTSEFGIQGFISWV